MTDMRIEMPRTRARSGDQYVFRALVALTYPMFLVAALISRFAPMGRGILAKPDRRVSIFIQALRSGEASIAIAFAG